MGNKGFQQICPLENWGHSSVSGDSGQPIWLSRVTLVLLDGRDFKQNVEFTSHTCGRLSKARLVSEVHCMLLLYYCDQNTCKQEKVRSYLFWIMVSEGSVHGCLAHVLGQNIIALGMCGRTVFFPQEAGSKTGKDQGQATLKFLLSVTSFPQLRPTSPSLQNLPK
jgi:hypothetical protein